MKWLQDNPLGTALAAISGVLFLSVLIMAVVWSLPVSVDVAPAETEDQGSGASGVAARQLAPLHEHSIVNERPVFNESRLPVIGDSDEDLAEDTTVAVTDAPNVKLTGVIITSDMKIASLTPADADQEAIMAHEGQSLTGEFVGWRVSAVSSRAVVLESRDGQELNLALEVHSSKIKEPPKPAPAVAAQVQPAQAEQAVGEDGEPLSRAEQIRQRIAERREELRLEQEAAQAQNQSQAQTDATSAGAKNSTSNASDYQKAIRAMMNKKSKDQGSNDKKDG